MTLKVLTAGATREGFSECASAFKSQTGIAIDTATTHGHLIHEQVIVGQTNADMVLLPSHMIEDLQQKGLASDTDCIEIGVIRIGAAVRAAETVPDVSTLDSLTQTLLSARSLVLTTAPSGVHMDTLIGRLGLSVKLADRITRYDTGTMVNEHLIESELAGEVAFGVATEILFCRDKGVAYAGPIPEKVQMSHRYCAVRLNRSDKVAPVRQLLDYLQTVDARSVFASTGVDQE